MYTLHGLTWDDEGANHSTLWTDNNPSFAQEQATTSHTNPQSKCSTYTQVETWMVYPRLLWWAEISGGSCHFYQTNKQQPIPESCSHTHFHIKLDKHCIFLPLLLDECGTIWEQAWASPPQLVYWAVDKGRPYQRYVTTHSYWLNNSTWLVQQWTFH